MNELKQYVDVLLPVPIKQNFTYFIPETFLEEIKVGQRVIVQFGARKLYTGIVYQIHATKPDYETKPIETILDKEPIISELQFPFWNWIATYYCCATGEVMKAALPSGLKLESQSKIEINDNWTEESKLTDVEEVVYNFVYDNKQVSINEINKFAKRASSYAVIKALLNKGAINMHQKINVSYKPKLQSFVCISPEISTDVQVAKVLELIKNARKQTEAFMWMLNEMNFFSTSPKVDLPKKDLIEKGFTDSVLNSLKEKGLIDIVQKQIDRLSTPAQIAKQLNTLNDDQHIALNQIHKSFIDKDVVLLHGVTSSGKTEVYIKLIEEQLKMGKQVLYMLPEIVLTSQIITRLTDVFGSKAGIYHSKFNDAERVEIWNKVLAFENEIENSHQLILGARSSLFLPFRNLGLIIVDEEHENSYKQFDPAPRYNARDSAIVLANIHKAKVLLGTATPSFESYFNARSQKYGYVALTKRHGEMELPEIIVADIKDATKRKQMKAHFTPKLMEAMDEAFENGEQVILFQNRRGFSPFIQCNSCGWIPKCNNCDVSLTYHKYFNNLQCHYCGYTVAMPKSCTKCSSENIQTKGFGTEKVEDELKIIYPDKKIGRLDLDSTSSKYGFNKIIQKFSEGKTSILVGTQMVTKGLDFENVSVVGILNADNLLNFPDFRSFERSFQLMTQVSGRAGRKHRRGKVVIQTYQPEHPVIDLVVKGDYETLFNSLIDERKFFKYPPWFRLIQVTVKHKNKERVQTAARQLANILREKLGARVLGPEYPLIARVQLYYQLVIRIKFDRKESPSALKAILTNAIDGVNHFENNRSVIFNIDVDPQ